MSGVLDTTRQHGRAREHLAAVAVRLISERGYEATTVEDIAAAADYSPRTFFRQFASKEDAVFFDLPDILRPLQALLEPGAEPAYARVTAIVMDNAGAWDDRGRTQLFHDEPALYRRFLEFAEEWERVIAEVLAAERGTDAATDPRAQTLASAVVGACRASFRTWLASGTGTAADHLAAALAELGAIA
ncbi:MAG: hypothetical protein QOF76_2747 [Solirubrobacteraceae bacterium]|jgi:AcrR family transcriptional regulator|nr:hypothetical protein [Solirubrobacteraceae bacterium]